MVRKLINAKKIKKDNTTYTRPEGAGNYDNMDDFNIVNYINCKTGTVELEPTEDKHLVNKKYVDSLLGKIEIVSGFPTSPEEGAMILNSSNDSIYIYYLSEWRLLHTIKTADEYLLQENGSFLLQENGSLIIL